MSDVKELNINNTTYDIKAKSVVDTNSGKLKFWSGTRQEYDAIVTKDSNTLYNITDDSDVTFALLELLFPVGAVYFGTMSVCPLQTLGVGTWQALPQDKVIQIAGTRGGVGDTLEAGLPNITGETGQTDCSAYTYNPYNTGAFYTGGESKRYFMGRSGESTNTNGLLHIDASRSSSIYGNSDTVQPDAYLLNGWRRIA